MATPLPDDIVQSINRHGKLGREAWQRGAVAEAEASFIDAWNLLPEPKTEYDYAQSLSQGLVTFYRDTKQYDKAKRWIQIARAAYGPGIDDSVEFLAGTVHFEAGDLDRAFEIFDELYKKYRQRPFQGEDKKYLAFYRKRAGKR